jgi:hypothetical protein
MNGIGAELPARDIETATKLQRIYFNHLCIQAGLGDGGCALDTYDGRGWSLVVQQGMNDIDRRCDAYLEWLDNQHRSKGPLLSQISSIQGATTTIMGLISPGSGAALSIVGEAFGLLRQSVENYHSRLLIDIEPSTRNSVVLRALSDFRHAYGARSVANKPEAEYVLREYLRRCLPFAIETQINDLSTLGSQGIRASEENSIFKSPVEMTTGSSPASPDQRVVFVDRKRSGIKDESGNSFSKTGDIKIASWIQEALCLKADGVFGADTRAAIAEFEARNHLEKADEADKINGKLDADEENTLIDAKACPSGFKNYTERIELSAQGARELLRDLIKAKFGDAPASSDLAGLRPSILKWRGELGLNAGKPNNMHDWVTVEFLLKINWFG